MRFYEGEHSYRITLEVTEYKKTGIVVTTDKTSVSSGGYSELADIVTFQKELSDIFKKMRKASKRGAYISFEITSAIYNNRDTNSYFDRWTFCGVNPDIDGIHITADTRYTPCYKDAYIYFNTCTLFAEFAELVRHTLKDL